eukprot:9075259-Karenia_brevis.AAC.1
MIDRPMSCMETFLTSDVERANEDAGPRSLWEEVILNLQPVACSRRAPSSCAGDGHPLNHIAGKGCYACKE